jgi:predicted SnoaL-like aldol condensation-catalyzing enzyme
VGRFSRQELQEALDRYSRAVDGFSESGDWSGFADLFTEDVVYTEHSYGVFQGREAVRKWIVDVMKPFPKMRFSHEWVAFDEDNDAMVVCIRNILDHPSDSSVDLWFPNWSRVVYAGDGLFSSQEDVYNPHRDAPRVVGEWLQAGGKLLAEPITMKYA